MKNNKKQPSIYELYEESVQNVDADIDLALRIYKHHNNSMPKNIREDFCGAAKLSTEWIKRDKLNRAFAIDLNSSILKWGVENHLSYLTENQRKRISLLCQNSLTCNTPKADVTFALNFSFCVFRTRELLFKYFQNVLNSLKNKGLFILDIYGGTEAISVKEDIRKIDGFKTKNGFYVPRFEYIWEQSSYNPINHYTTCHIHFKIPGHKIIRRAFSYKWRLWTLAEIKEIMMQAGFNSADVYIHGFDKNGDSDEVFRRRKTYENAEGWIAYVAGIK